MVLSIYAFLLAGVWGGVNLLKQTKSHRILPFIIFSDVLVLYFFHLVFERLHAGFLTLVFLHGALFLSGTVVFIKSRTKKERVCRFFTTGLLSFSIVFIVFSLLIKGLIPSLNDEFSFWAISAKKMYIMDALYCNPITGSGSYNEYPPGMQLVQYIGMSLFGKWSDDVLYISYWTVIFSVCCFFTPDVFINRKRAVVYVLSVITVCVMAITIGEPFYESLYFNLAIDFPLGVCFAFGIALLLEEQEAEISSRKSIIQICLVSAFIILLKQSGKIFVALLIIAYIIKNLVFHTDRKKIKTLVACLLPVLFSLCIALSWEMIYKHYSAEPAFSLNRFNMADFFNTIFGKTDSEISRQIRDRFFHYICWEKASFGIIDTSNFIFVFIMSVLYALLILVSSLMNCKTTVCVVIAIFIGWVLYSLGLLSLYLFTFDEREGLELASIQRYLNSYNTGLWLSFVFHSFRVFDHWINKKKYAMGKKNLVNVKHDQTKLATVLLSIFMLFPCLSSPHNQFISLVHGRYQQIASSKMETLNKLAADLPRESTKIEKVGELGTVLLIHNGADYPHEAINGFAYLVYPGYNVPWECMFGDQKTFADDRYTHIYSAKEFQDHIHEIGAQYIAIDRLDEAFVRLYSSLFDEELKNGQIYEIKSHDQFALMNADI